MKKEKKDLICLFFVSVISFFSSLWAGKVGLMEARNFVTAREMVRYGNWIIPTMNGNFRFEKPPFPTWITAIFMKIFNTTSNEFILRIPVACLTVIMIFLVYYLVKIGTNNHKLAYVTGLVTSTTFMIIKLGNENTWDMFGYILIFGFITFIFKGLKTSNNTDFIIGGIFLGTSLLSKGPVPFYGMALPFFISYIFIYGFYSIKSQWKKLLLSVVIGIILASFWPLLMIIYEKDIFMNVMNKEISTWTTKHTRGFFYYFDYFIYTGVWFLFVIASFHKKWIDGKVENKKFFSFLFFWNLLALLLLSLVKMKKERYAIPLYILSPMMGAHLIDYYLKKDWTSIFKREKILLKFHFLIMLVISFGIPALFYFQGFRKGYVGKIYFIFIGITFISLGSFFIKVIFEKEKLKRGLYATGILMLTVTLSTTWFVERIVMDGVRKDYLPLSSLKSNLNISAPILTLNSDEISNVWNIGRKIEKFKNGVDLPVKFLLLDEWKEEKIEKIISPSYKIINYEIYYKYQDENKLIYLYNIEKT